MTRFVACRCPCVMEHHTGVCTGAAVKTIRLPRTGRAVRICEPCAEAIKKGRP